MGLDSLKSLGSQLGGMSQEGNLQSAIKSGALDFINNKVNLKSLVKTAPIPTPPKPRAIKPTAFQISPFAEKVMVDPYKTYNLNVLGQTELAIDEVSDYLASILPKDLIRDLMANAQLAGHLLKQGMDLASAVMQIKNSLPQNLNLASLLRKVNIGVILSGTASLLASATLRKLNLGNLPSIFIEDAFSFMHLSAQFSNSSSHYNHYESNSYRVAAGVSSSYVSNSVTNAAISYAQVKAVCSNPISTISVYDRLPIALPIQLLKLTNTMDSSRFNVLASSITVYGLTDSNRILDALTTQSSATSRLIVDLLDSAQLANYRLAIDALVKNGLSSSTHSTELVNLADAINLYGTIVIQSIIDASTPPDTVALDLIRSNLHTQYPGISDATIDLLFSNIATLGTEANALLVTITDSTLTPIELSAILSDIVSLGFNTVQSMVSMSELTSAQSVHLFVQVAGTSDLPLLKQNVEQISKLTTTDLDAIVTQLTNQEPMTFLYADTLDPAVKLFLTREALEAAAGSGNYRMVFNILTNTDIAFTTQYKKFLIRETLKNFVITEDMLALGLTYLREDLAAILEAIVPEWHLVKRGTDYIYDQSFFMVSSAEALTTLASIPTFAIPAQLQLDNHYIN